MNIERYDIDQIIHFCQGIVISYSVNFKDMSAGAIILGLLGLAALVKLSERKCPVCNRIIPITQNTCSHCGYRLSNS
ncbi:zinc ribbon domain-containing protein [Nitrosarchaeum koreense]|uniref:zinc ribbon domain-containing protein n=1 Tax=Nitrosarchaeum koreense TaxID=1088740 RepID=UPI0012FEB1C0|nr:zinc ribbon domain-containing protein [Nitrosarchaeum koreense]